MLHKCSNIYICTSYIIVVLADVNTMTGAIEMIERQTWKAISIILFILLVVETMGIMFSILLLGASTVDLSYEEDCRLMCSNLDWSYLYSYDQGICDCYDVNETSVYNIDMYEFYDQGALEIERKNN